MNFNEYINNPMGKKNSVYTNRNMYADLYKSKLNNILVRENGKIHYELYRDKDDYIIYFKIPSETIDKFYYDIVIRFFTNDKNIKLSSSISEYDIQVFSNDPHFAYTYLNLFLRNDMFFDDMRSKVDKTFLVKEANEKNPDDQIGYVKSLYFSYLIMKRDLLFSKNRFALYGTSYNKKKLLDKIEYVMTKINNRKDKEEKLKNKKKREKKTTTNNKENKKEAKKNKSSNNVNVIQKMKKITPKKSSIKKIK